MGGCDKVIFHYVFFSKFQLDYFRIKIKVKFREFELKYQKFVKNFYFMNTKTTQLMLDFTLISLNKISSYKEIFNNWNKNVQKYPQKIPVNSTKIIFDKIHRKFLLIAI